MITRRTALILVALAVLAIAAAQRPVCYAQAASETENIIVKYKGEEDITVIQVADNIDYQSTLKKYKHDSKVDFAEPEYLYNIATIPSDTYFDKQWYLKKIKAPRAWDITRDSPSKVIAIIDSGIQTDHIDLRSNIWENPGEVPGNNKDDDGNGFIDDHKGWNFVDNNADPTPDFKGEYTEAGILHGTLVAGVAAASGNNGSGVAGVTWGAKIMPLKVLNGLGEGRSSQVVRAIDYATDNGADIINLSFVGLGYSQALQEAIDRANAEGIIVVAAAGNEKSQGKGYDLDADPMYPVCHDGVVGVAATDTLDQKPSFSSHGLKCVDISAPGESIFGLTVYAPQEEVNGRTLNKHYDGYWSGTSMAAPIVSGTLALIGGTNPGLSRSQVEDILLNKADNINKLNPGYVGQMGSGRVNVYASVLDSHNRLQNKQSRILIAPASNNKSEIKLLDKDNNLKNNFLAFGENFSGGADVAAGDIDGDGVDEIITGAGFGGGPHVRIFNRSGGLVGQFFAYAPHFRGGVNVAAGDIDGDGVDEIITGAGFGGGPQVRVFRKRGELVTQFFGFSEHFRGGVNVATADINGGAAYDKDEIVIAPGAGGGPQVRIFNNHAQLIDQFFAYDKNFKGGVDLGGGDINKDGVDEIITGAGAGGGPHVRIFNARGDVLDSLYGFDRDFGGGVNVEIALFQL
jgi:subtilisin family serine protease